MQNEKFFNSITPKSNHELLEKARPLVEEYKSLLSSTKIRDALSKANEISSLGNKYLQEKQPWIEVKTNPVLAGITIANCLDLARLLAVIYYPFTPSACEKIFQILGEKEDILKIGFERVFEGVEEGRVITPKGILFEKLEDKKITELKQKFG
jgi:methionyl-tRNA synthetase